MTAIRRLVSGFGAAWIQTSVALVAQVILVPVYLTFWDKETYGIWLTIQAINGLVTVLDSGHQNYLANEFLKVGERDRELIRRIFYSSLPIAALIGLIELVIVTGVVAAGAHRWLFGLDIVRYAGLLKQAGIVLIVQSFVWLIFGCCGGIAGRVTIPFGYYPRLAWWGVLASIVTISFPAIAVICGADLLQAGIVLGLTTCLYNIPLFVDIWAIMRCERLLPVNPVWTIGRTNLFRSLLLTGKTFLEMARQQGVRLILSLLIGPAEMAAFVTMRTGANVGLQGLSSVTNPLMPELMRFLRRRDQPRSEAAFGIVWLIVLAMGPALIVLQWQAPFLFDAWTRGKFAFDPLLFASLSVGMLVFALAQPAMSVVQGNNLLREQLLLSAVSGGAVVSGLFIFVPILGKRGAGVALIVAEVISLAGYVMVASSWLRTRDIRWPFRSFATVAISVAIDAVALPGISLYPGQSAWIISSSMAAQVCLFALYWLQLPEIARSRAESIMSAPFWASS